MSATVTRLARPLRPYQREAVNRTVAHFGAGRERGQLLMACGTGKTITGQRAVEALTSENQGATILLLFPSLALVQQTYESWLEHAVLDFEAFALCSGTRAKATQTNDVVDLNDDALTLNHSTDPGAVAAWLQEHAGRRRVLFATYQSIDKLVGAPGIPEWDLAVFDEAHRTAGAEGSKFATALHQELVPARRRLFMTATQRTFKRSQGKVEITDMNNRSLYGNVIFNYTHAQAVDDGVISDFKVVLVKVTNDEVRTYIEADAVLTTAYNQATGKEQEIRAREAASAVAVVRASKEYGLHATLTFHHKIANAEQFSHTLEQVVTIMDPSEKPSAELVAAHVSGQDIERRDEVIGQLERIGDGWMVVSNARVLTEGVNVVNLDSLAFVDPKRSAIDTVQAVGRILRKPDPTTGPGLIVLPVVVDEGGDIDEALAEAKFDVIHDTLLALRTMAPEFITELRRPALAPDEDDKSESGGEKEAQEPSAAIEASPHLDFLGTGISAAFIRSVQLRAYSELRKSSSEEEGLIEHMLESGRSLDYAEREAAFVMAELDAERTAA